MATIFISYRRADCASETGRIYDHLAQRYGKGHIFKDVDSIPPGVRFPDYIQESISASDVALVVIGPRWLSASAGFGRRRLDDPADFVRIEIETALRLGIAVIPALVSGAALPQPRQLPQSLRPLLEQNGLAVRQDPDFARDMERVFAAIDYWQAQPRRPTAPAPAPTPPPTPPRAEPAADTVAPAPRSEPTPRLELAAATPSALTKPAGAVRKPQAGKPAGKRVGRRRIAPALAAVAALLVVVVAVVALLPGVFGRWLGGSSVSAQQTQVAQQKTAAANANASATRTQAAIDARKVYAPAGIGPCDPTEQFDPSDRQSQVYPAYWQKPEDPTLVTCAKDHKTAIMTYHGVQSSFPEVTFWGVPANYYVAAGSDSGFPANYTITLDANFTSSQSELTGGQGGQDGYCLQVDIQSGAGLTGRGYHRVEVCRDGSWSASSSASAPTFHHAPLIKAPLRFTITVSEATIAFRVNGVTLMQPTAMGGDGTTGYLDIYLFSLVAGHGATVSNFVLTPR